VWRRRQTLTIASQKEHDTLDMLTRNRLANISFFVCSCGELVVLAILAGILEGIITDAPDSNTRALSIVCAYSAGVWSELKPTRDGDDTDARQSSALYLGCTMSNTGPETLFLQGHHTSPLGPSCLPDLAKRASLLIG
jgi:hypothetical protein